MKTKQINKVKVQVFEEKELKEKLGLGEDQIRLILNYQEKFPELLQNSNCGFCIDARKLHNQLVENVKGKNLQGREIKGTRFDKWITGRIDKYNFRENEDFKSEVFFDHARFSEVEVKNMSSQKRSANGMSTEYKLSLNMAKELCMIENNEMGKETRKYFILVEETFRNYEEWNISRGLEKDGWKEMTDEIKKWCILREYDYEDRIFYTREANMINLALLDLRACDINAKLKNNDKMTRNHLFTKINDALHNLQQINISLLMANMDFEQRKIIIETTCKNKYSHLKDEFNKIINN